MCSSVGRTSLGLNFGKHFIGCTGSGCNGPTFWTAPGFFHALWAIMAICVEEYVPIVEGDWVEEACSLVPV